MDDDKTIGFSGERKRLVGVPTICWRCNGRGKMDEAGHVCNICFGIGNLY